MESNLDDAWKAYMLKYGTYSSAVYRSRLAMLIADAVLAEYPNKLPLEIQNLIVPRIRAFEKLLSGEQTGGALETNSKERQAGVVGEANSREDEITWETRSILTATMGAMIFQLGEPKPETGTSGLDFSRIVYSHEVVMQIAYLDGFVKDTMIEICRLRPEVLKSGKQIDWATAINCGGWSNLMDHLAEEHVSELTRCSLRERVNWFEKRGMNFGLAETRIPWLEEAENVRHIIVHNDGKVDQQFLRRTGRKDLPIGEPFPLNLHYVLRVYTGSKVIASTLVDQMAEKFFGVSLPKR